MKIAIISQFNLTNVNYGNKLQAYALNLYLREHMQGDNIESLYFLDYGKNYKTRRETCWNKLWKKAKKIPKVLTGDWKRTSKVDARLNRFIDFSKNYMVIPDKAWSWEDLENNDFDLIVVGSDIVWGQTKGSISRKFFLDFDGKKEFGRVAYAASFGRDWIPEENMEKLHQYLSRFQSISVRESSSVSLLERIGIYGAEYVVDPTLLLPRKNWKSIEKEPEQVTGKFIFVYFLGRGRDVRNCASAIAERLNLNIVTVPYATGKYNKLDENFGDTRLLECSIEEWLWLIDNAEVVITDSFHGTIFSTIFEKKFIVLERKYDENINNRMIDFLKNIGQTDKMIQTSCIQTISEMKWDYEEIKKKLTPIIDKSQRYIEESIVNYNSDECVSF